MNPPSYADTAIHGHAHEWQQTDTDPHAWVCTWCPEKANACTECARPVDGHLVACTPCIDRAKRWITDVIDGITTVPFHHAEITGLRSPRYDRDLVTTSSDRDRLPFGLDAIVDDPEDPRIAAIKHPASALAILHDWAHAWADTRNESIQTHELDYLVDHTLWAVQNPDNSGWDTYRDEARCVRAAIRRLLGLQPQPVAAPCTNCASTIVRDWTSTGLDDIHRCTRCGATWPDEGRLQFATRQRVLSAPDTDPDTLVTLEQVRIAMPDLKRNTINQALKRDRDRSTDPTYQPRLPGRGTNPRGQALYRLGDFTRLTKVLVA